MAEVTPLKDYDIRAAILKAFDENGPYCVNAQGAKNIRGETRLYRCYMGGDTWCDWVEKEGEAPHTVCSDGVSLIEWRTKKSEDPFDAKTFVDLQKRGHGTIECVPFKVTLKEKVQTMEDVAAAMMGAAGRGYHCEIRGVDLG